MPYLSLPGLATAMPKAILLYFLLIWVAPAYSSSGQAVTVPFTEAGGLILLEATVNGQSGHLILDTGAGGLVLNQAHFSAVGGQKSTARGLLGEVQVGYLQVQNLTIGLLRLNPGHAQVVDLSHLQQGVESNLLGLLGYAMLKDYEITLKYQEKVVIFTPLGALTKLSSSRVDSFPFQLENFLPVLRIKVEGEVLRMGLDTGAGHNLLDKRHAGALRANFQKTGKVKVRSSDGRAKMIEGGRLYRLHLGGRYRCGAMRTLLINLTSLKKLYRTELDGILGREFLAPWVFTINYQKRMLYVHRVTPRLPPAPAVAPATPVVSSRTLF